MSDNEMLMGESQCETDLSSLDEEEKLLIASENFQEAMLDEFRKNTFQSKKELVTRMEQARARFQQEAVSEEKKHNPAFYAILDDLYERALKELFHMAFPEPLHDWWYFFYEITATGLTVRMNHIEWQDISSCERKESFVLLDVPVRLLTVSEFAERYGVGPTTVRSWIRRAKIRSVVKYGSEWRIPELAEVREERSYIPCQYVWMSTLTDVPEKYAYLKEFAGMDLEKEYGKNIYLGRPRLQEDVKESHWLDLPEFAEKRRKILSKYKNVSATEDGILILNANERAALELYLISSPLVQFRKDGDFKFNYQIIEEGSEFCGRWNAFSEKVEDWL